MQRLRECLQALDQRANDPYWTQQLIAQCTEVLNLVSWFQDRVQAEHEQLMHTTTIVRQSLDALIRRLQSLSWQ